MKNQTFDVSKLQPHPNNPRTISEEEERLLDKSISEDPEILTVRPIAYDSVTGWVWAGNQRLKSLLRLGYSEIPKEWVKDIAEWSEEKKLALMFKDNKQSGEWDWDIIESEFETVDLEGWGIVEPAIELVQEELILECAEDDFNEEISESPKTVLGDLYEIGGHRLICGDSTDSDAVAKLMNGNKADMVFTSPPYNQGGGGMKYDYNGDTKKLYQQNTDKKTESEYFDFCISIFNIIKLNTKSNAAVFWNVSYNANARADYGKIVFSELNPFDVYETIIWDKGIAFPTASKGILSRTCEFIFLLSCEKYFTTQGENEPMYNVWRISSFGAQNDIHKACFPVGLPEKGIRLCSKEKGLIYEPFCGSGTTMAAAHQLNRNCYGVELDPKYCDLIISRMLKLDASLTVKRNGKNVTSEFV